MVSVLMTAYNREKYIGEAINSVLASTYTNLELIIVDDGSKDKTVEIAGSFAKQDERVKVYVNEKNLGDYPNRNQAAAYAKGKYLKYVDADDYIYPWGLHTLVNCMEQFPGAGYGLCSLEQDRARPFPFELTPREAYRYNYFGPGLFHKAPLSSIISVTAFQAVGGFGAIRMAGDCDMWHRLSAKYPVVLMPHGVVWYREHENQEMNDYRKYMKIYDEVRCRALNDSLCPLTADEINALKQKMKKRYSRQAIKSLVKLKISNATEYWKLRDSYSK